MKFYSPTPSDHLWQMLLQHLDKNKKEYNQTSFNVMFMNRHMFFLFLYHWFPNYS